MLINEQINLKSVEQINLSEQASVYSPNQHLYTGSLGNNITFNTVFHNEKIEAKRFFDSALSDNQLVLFNGQNLSIGERQKLLLERCLNKQANIYIFDEPTGNLDRESRRILYDTLISLKEENKIIVLISHDPELFDICDKQINL